MMKKNILSAAVFGLFLTFALPAGASWLIDPFKFADSVHAQNSCQDCHQEIAEKDLHPDPANVTRPLAEFFTIERCTSCHDDVAENLKQATHGSLDIKDPKKYEDCLRCHNPHEQGSAGSPPPAGAEPPEFSAEDQACLGCHALRPLDDPAGRKSTADLCFHCHARGDAESQKITAQSVALIDPDRYRKVAHADLDCLICHPQAPGYEHDAQQATDCRQCHPRHDEKVAHDAHLTVACAACHLKDVRPLKEAQTGRILWQSERKRKALLEIHDMRVTGDPAECRRCHVVGNPVGAAAMVLPPKSLLCMPCHAATFSIGDTTTIVSLIVLLFGLAATFSTILSGTIAGTNDSGLLPRFVILIARGFKAVFSARFYTILKTLLTDVLLQRRLFERSIVRWVVHSLIFLPFVFRFCWGIIALSGSLIKPEASWVWPMLDKNNAATAFVFDLTGLLILVGIVLALLRGLRQTDRPANLPNQDRLALGLLVAIVLIGFVLEGMRIAMTGSAHDAAYAFVGYGIHLLFAGSDAVSRIYGYVWYLHAVAVGGFVAYLPFSRLLHIIMAPIVLSMRALSDAAHNH